MAGGRRHKGGEYRVKSPAVDKRGQSQASEQHHAHVVLLPFDIGCGSEGGERGSDCSVVASGL